MLVERYVSSFCFVGYFLAGWHASDVSLPPGDVTFVQLAFSLNDVIFCLHWEQLTYLSTNIERLVVPLNVEQKMGQRTITEGEGFV